MAENETIIVYMTGVPSTLKLKKNQTKIRFVLESKKIPFENIDISINEADKIAMRDKCGNPTALPPQIFRGDKYLGDYDAFENAVEGEAIMEFCGITE